MSAVPIHQVRADGTVRSLGSWLAAERTLELHAEGFPLLPAGRHQLPGDLPWVFWDMCPSGFLGREFAGARPALRLPSDPRVWQAADALRALTEGGDDLTGNLIIGDRALQLWHERRQREEEWRRDFDEFRAGRTDRIPGAERVGGIERLSGRPWDLDVDAWLSGARRGEGSSSVGGERPKLCLAHPDGSATLVKYSPPRGSPMGQRWSDLLRTEGHCAATLRRFGVGAVECVNGLRGDRTTLSVSRYDRLPGWGRRGAVTLYWLALERHGDIRLPAPAVLEALVDDGHLRPGEAQVASQVHAFSAALGNDDAHLGNYGLVFDDQGRASLAPFFDILPMALAPRHDELPDAQLARLPLRAPGWSEPIRTWLAALVDAVEADVDISRPFVATWRRLIGA